MINILSIITLPIVIFILSKTFIKYIKSGVNKETNKKLWFTSIGLSIFSILLLLCGLILNLIVFFGRL